MLIDELLNGQRKFKFAEDGTQTWEQLPPTSREIRTANILKQLVLAKEGLGKSIETLQREVVSIIDQYNQYDREYKQLEELVINNTTKL